MSRAHAWRSRTGQVVAYGGHDEDGCWMHWPNLATYRFDRQLSDITAHLEPAAPSAIVWDTCRRSVVPMALQARGWEALHASAILCTTGVVAFCAASETGKSSIAYGLARRGFPQWADDAVVISADGDVASVPLPYEVRLRPSAERLFRSPLPTPRRSDRNDRGDQHHHSPAPVAAMCVLERSERPIAASECSLLDSSAAFRALLTHAHEFDPYDRARRAAMVESYLDIAARIPVHRVVFNAQPEGIDALLDTLVRVLGITLAPQVV